MFDNHVVTDEQHRYIQRLAYRLIRFRKSASIDSDDLVSAAEMRWWQYCMRTPELTDTSSIDALFRQHIKFAMRDLLRDSTPVKVTRTYKAQLQAYDQPYTVELDHAIDITAGEEHVDTELWMDVTTLITKLPEKEQIVLALYHTDGYSFTEIAYALDVSVSTVTRMYKRSIDSLKINLAQTTNARKK